jgi:hypothetical protein
MTFVGTKVTREQAKRLTVRRQLYEKALAGKLEGKFVLVVGDRPGPSAPKDPGYHHTPFYSIKHCSGWLNRLLDAHEIPEEKLLWINSTLADGTPFDARKVEDNIRIIVALGGNAEKWVKANFDDRVFAKVHHPQYWKRFRSKEPYPLIEILRGVARG